MASTCSSLCNSSKINLRIMSCSHCKCNYWTICKVIHPQPIPICLTRTFRTTCSIISRTKQVIQRWQSPAQLWLAITLVPRKSMPPCKWKMDSRLIFWKISKACLKCNKISSAMVSRIISLTKANRIFRIRFNSN